MATDHNFRIKNGLTVGAVEVIDSSGKLTSTAFGTNADEKIEDVAAAMITGATHSNITVTYNDTNGTLAFSAAAQYGDSDVESYLDGGTSTPSFASVTSSGNIKVESGSNQVLLNTDGAVEITRSAGNPYIDFKNSTSDDYDQRLQINSGNFNFSAPLQVAGTTFIDTSLNLSNIGTISSGAITATTVNTGQGANELYAMNQNVRTTDSPTFDELTVTDFVKATGNNLKFSAGGTHVLNIDVNGKIYPNTHNAYDIGFSSTTAFRNAHFSGVGNFGTINTGQGATEVHLMNQNVRTTDSPTFAGLTTTGNIVAEDSEVRVGDTSGDNWTRIKHAQADGYGFDWQHDNATVIVNEQGSTNEVLVLGDVDAGNYSGLFGIAHTTDSGSNWTKKLDLKGNGELYIGASGTSHVYHEGHKPTYSELGTMAYSNLTGTPTIPTNNNQLTNGAGYATTSYVDTSVSNLVDSAPTTLDTLNELAAALGDDANFSTTVTNSIAGKLSLTGGTMTGNLTISPSGSKIILDAYNTSVQEGGGIFFREGFSSSNKYNLSIMARSRSNDGSTDGLSINAYEGITFSTGSNSYNERLYLHSSAAFTVPITTTGTVTASGGNSGNWNTAYGWGNHASAGYLTSFDITTQTDSKYIRSDTSDNASGPIVFGGGTATQYFRRNNTTNYTNAPLIVESYGGSTSTTGIGFHISGQLGRYLRMNSAGVLAWEGSTIWHAGNDGPSSGLNADLLDDQHGSYYLNYNNLTNKPTIPTNNNQLTNGAGYITDGNTNWNNTYGFITDTSGTAKGTNQNYVASSTSTSNRGNYGAGVWAYSGYSTGSNRPFTYDATLQVMANSAMGFELSVDWLSQTSTPIKIRSLRDCCQGWSDYSTIWTSTTDGANSGLDADLLDGQEGSYYLNYNNLTNKPTIPTNNNQLTNGAGYLTQSSAFNNQGQAHSTRTSFATGSPSFPFGFNFVQGNGNSPGVNSASQYYSLYTGLGSQYPATGSGSYGMELAIPRNVSSPYIAIRYNENNGLGSWQKISAGYADSAGSVAWSNVSGAPTIPTNNNQLTNGAGYTTNLGFARYNANTTYSTYSNRQIFYSNTNMATSSSYQSSLEVFASGSGSDAFMSFHVGGDYAIYLGLDGGTNKLSVGGWSMGANSYEIYHSGNKPSLATLGYTGATNANYITNNNQLTNGAGYVTASTSSLSNYLVKGGSWNASNMPGSRWGGFAVNGGEVVFQRDNPNTGQMSVMVDGNFYAGENNGFWSLYSGNNYNLKVGMTSNTSGHLVLTAGTIRATGEFCNSNYAQGTMQDGALNIGNTGLNYAYSGTTWASDVRAGIMANCSETFEFVVHDSGDSVDSFMKYNGTDFEMGNNIGWGTTTFTFASSITAAGNVTAYSDIKLKEDIKLIENAVEKVKGIRGVTYRRNDLDDTETRHSGVIAQEVEKVLPEVVHYDEKKDVKSVSYGNMVGLLIEAVKEQQEQIEELKSIINTLVESK